MLEVIENDFSRLDSDTKPAEATAQKEYESLMTESKVTSMIHPDSIASYTSLQHAVLDEFSDFTYTISSRALTDNEVILAEMISWKHQLQS